MGFGLTRQLRRREPRRNRSGVVRMAVAALVCLGFVVGAHSAQAGQRTLSLGITDPWSLQQGSDAENAQWFDRVQASRASFVLLPSLWLRIAPGNPTAAFDATDPADPEYTWEVLDAAVRNATKRGLTPAIMVTIAPDWAEGKGRPSGFEIPKGDDTTTAVDGTWKPRVDYLADYAEAIARRYTGAFTDPDDPLGGPLPRVRHFQLWQEPNLAIHLAPRFENGKPFAAIHYRKMLRGFWGGVHAADKKNKVITGGTGPYGDGNPDGVRTSPVEFWRDVLCLKGQKLKKLKCKKPAKFDIAAHHPINTGPPRQKAFDIDNASTPDMGKIKRVLRKAAKTGRVKPKGNKPQWATEIWWDSNPPDDRPGKGVDLQTQARYVSESMYLLWKQGVRTAIWFTIRDLAPPVTYTSYSSGLYTKQGEPKPALSAFRFPFAVDKRKRGMAKVWGIGPSKGKVIIELEKGSRWKKIGTTKAGGGRIFSDNMKVPKAGMVRARRGSEASLGWKLR